MSFEKFPYGVVLPPKTRDVGFGQVISRPYTSYGTEVVKVRTDYGNTLTVNEEELRELWDVAMVIDWEDSVRVPRIENPVERINRQIELLEIIKQEMLK